MAPSEPLSRRQQQTLPARQALARTFASPEEQSAHFRGLAQRSHARRITLSGDDAAALLQAYALLGAIAERARAKLDGGPDEGVACAGDDASPPAAGACGAEKS